MTRDLFLMAFVAAIIVGCSGDDIPTNMHVDGPNEATAGKTISLSVGFAVYHGRSDELRYTWRAPSPPCNVELKSTTESQINVQIGDDCQAHKILVQVEVVTPKKLTSRLTHEISVSATPKLSKIVNAPDAETIIPSRVVNTFTFPSRNGKSVGTNHQQSDGSYKVDVDAERVGSGFATACWELSDDFAVAAGVLEFSIRTSDPGVYRFKFDSKRAEATNTVLKKTLTKETGWSIVSISADDFSKAGVSAFRYLCIAVDKDDRPPKALFELQKVVLRSPTAPAPTTPVPTAPTPTAPAPTGSARVKSEPRRPPQQQDWFLGMQPPRCKDGPNDCKDAGRGP